MGEGKRVLLVEDEIMIALEVSDMIEELGHDVVGPAFSAADGRDIVGRERIDLALIDVNLGRGTTSEPVAEALRAQAIPFVYVTAYDRTHVPFARPGEPIVSKPLSLDALSATLDRDSASPWVGGPTLRSARGRRTVRLTMPTGRRADPAGRRTARAHIAPGSA